eukprot:12159635-Ditylum_brightwellii.AAC.1
MMLTTWFTAFNNTTAQQSIGKGKHIVDCPYNGTMRTAMWILRSPNMSLKPLSNWATQPPKNLNIPHTTMSKLNMEQKAN